MFIRGSCHGNLSLFIFYSQHMPLFHHFSALCVLDFCVGFSPRVRVVGNRFLTSPLRVFIFQSFFHICTSWPWPTTCRRPRTSGSTSPRSSSRRTAPYPAVVSFHRLMPHRWERLAARGDCSMTLPVCRHLPRGVSRHATFNMA